MSHPVAYPALLAPIALSGKQLRNRVVHASMTTRLAKNLDVTERFIQYYVNRAKGGAAMIVSEPLNAAPHQNVAERIRVWNDDNLDGLRRWADAVESHDCRLLGQIQDPGRGRHVAGQNMSAIGPSVLADDISWTVPRALSAAEIRDLVESFAQSADRLNRCGFSGVEISCGHGHLFHQFLSPWSNIRTDEYGGNVDGRTRFVAELVTAIRELCGGDFIIGLKLPGNDGVANGIDPAEAAKIAIKLTASAEVSYVCFAQGSHASSLEMHIPDDYGPRAPYLDLIRELRKTIPGIPLVALGRITDPAEADAIVARGDAELIGLGRALMADPAWLMKAAQGRAHDIRYCASRNNCWSTGRSIDCENNPRLAEPDEVDWWPRAAEVRRRIVVVGAGIAGLEAAWIAAARGHEVTLFSRSNEVGGKMRLRSMLPGGESSANIFNYQLAAAQKAGAHFKLGVSATADDVISLHPDVAILACGANMVSPRWLPQHIAETGLVPDLRSAMWSVVGLRTRQSGTAVIFDMDHTEGTYASAELLHELFERVVVMTTRDTIATEAPLVTRQGIWRRFGDKRIETLCMAQPRWTDSFENGRLQYAKTNTGAEGVIENVAFLAYATPRVPDAGLAAPLRAAGIEVHLIGDCLAPRNAHSATAEGSAIGNTV